MTYFVFICDGYYQAGAIGVVAEGEQEAVELVLQYSRECESRMNDRYPCKTREADGYSFYIKPGCVLLESSEEVASRVMTTWVLDRSASVATTPDAVNGIKFHVYHDG